MESRDAVVAVGAAGAAEETREIAEGGHHRGDHLGTDPGRGHETVYEIGRGIALALPHHAAEPAPEPGLPLLLDSILQHRWRYLARLVRLTRRRQKREDLTTEMYSLKLLSQHRYKFRVKFAPFLINVNIFISIHFFRAPSWLFCL